MHLKVGQTIKYRKWKSRGAGKPHKMKTVTAKFAGYGKLGILVQDNAGRVNEISLKKIVEI